MLRFGARPGRSGRPEVDAESSQPDQSRPVRVLPRTPVYPSGPTPSVRVAGDAPRVRQVKRILGDGMFHAPSELVVSLSPSEAVAALGELGVSGYSFDAVGGSIRMRPRGRGEVPVKLLDVVGGLSFARPGPAEVAPAAPERRGVREVRDVQETEVKVGLVLSDPPPDLTIPLDWVPGMTSAILSTRGSGKTYLAGVVVEELRAKVPDTRVVVLDPTGASWGLAATAGGAPSDLGAVLLGGDRGACPLDARSGRALAELVGELGGRVVVCDLSGMSKSEVHALAADFFERLHVLPAFPLHVLLDEADLFVPQQFGALGGDQKRCSEMVHEYFLRGRKSGRGGTIVSLRPAVVSKTILSVTECLYLLRMGEPNDLRAVEAWLTSFEHGVSEEHRRECLGQMPVLPRGTAYFLRGGEEATFRRFRVRAKRTFDSSRTLGSGGETCARCARLSAGDLERVREVLAGRFREEVGGGGE